MFVLVVGGGKVGYYLAKELIESGHEVALMEKDRTRATQIADEIGSVVISHDGCEGKYLAEAGCNRADVFIAMTEGDNRNVMSAQLATEALGAKQVVAKINDPLRASAYAELGIATLCRTNLMAHAVNEFLSLGLTIGPGLSPATGHHPGGEHHGAADDPLVAPGSGATGGPGATGEAATSAPSGVTDSSTTSAPAAPAIAREG